MFSENRALHSLGVARKCYILAKELNKSEEFCRKMFFLGWNHDIGYEFTDNKSNHEIISANILKSAGIIHYYMLEAIKFHGKTYLGNIEWEILSKADLLIDSNGNNTSIEKRLEEIKHKYGLDSNEYIGAKNCAIQLNLLGE